MKTFRHKHQLNQLRYLDPPAYTTADFWLRRGKPGAAAQVIKAAMYKAFIRLVTPNPLPANTLEMAQQIVQDKGQWYSGEAVNVWSSGPRRVWIKNKGGRLVMVAFDRSIERMGDRYSQGLVVGLLTGQGWEVALSAKLDYAGWLRS